MGLNVIFTRVTCSFFVQQKMYIITMMLVGCNVLHVLTLGAIIENLQLYLP